MKGCRGVVLGLKGSERGSGVSECGRLRQAVLFDVYRLANGEKSMAVRLTLNSSEATLAEAEIEASVAAVLQQLERTLGGRLRA